MVHKQLPSEAEKAAEAVKAAIKIPEQRSFREIIVGAQPKQSPEQQQQAAVKKAETAMSWLQANLPALRKGIESAFGAAEKKFGGVLRDSEACNQRMDGLAKEQAVHMQKAVARVATGSEQQFVNRHAKAAQQLTERARSEFLHALSAKAEGKTEDAARHAMNGTAALTAAQKIQEAASSFSILPSAQRSKAANQIEDAVKTLQSYVQSPEKVEPRKMEAADASLGSINQQAVRERAKIEIQARRNTAAKPLTEVTQQARQDAAQVRKSAPKGFEDHYEKLARGHELYAAEVEKAAVLVKAGKTNEAEQVLQKAGKLKDMLSKTHMVYAAAERGVALQSQSESLLKKPGAADFASVQDRAWSSFMHTAKQRAENARSNLGFYMMNYQKNDMQKTEVLAGETEACGKNISQEFNLTVRGVNMAMQLLNDAAKFERWADIMERQKTGMNLDMFAKAVRSNAKLLRDAAYDMADNPSKAIRNFSAESTKVSHIYRRIWDTVGKVADVSDNKLFDACFRADMHLLTVTAAGSVRVKKEDIGQANRNITFVVRNTRMFQQMAFQLATQGGAASAALQSKRTAFQLINSGMTNLISMYECTTKGDMFRALDSAKTINGLFREAAEHKLTSAKIDIAAGEATQIAKMIGGIIYPPMMVMSITDGFYDLAKNYHTYSTAEKGIKTALLAMSIIPGIGQFGRLEAGIARTAGLSTFAKAEIISGAAELPLAIADLTYSLKRNNWQVTPEFAHSAMQTIVFGGIGLKSVGQLRGGAPKAKPIVVEGPMKVTGIPAEAPAPTLRERAKTRVQAAMEAGKAHEARVQELKGRFDEAHTILRKTKESGLGFEAAKRNYDAASEAYFGARGGATVKERVGARLVRMQKTAKEVREIAGAIREHAREHGAVKTAKEVGKAFVKGAVKGVISGEKEGFVTLYGGLPVGAAAEGLLKALKGGAAELREQFQSAKSGLGRAQSTVIQRALNEHADLQAMDPRIENRAQHRIQSDAVNSALQSLNLGEDGRAVIMPEKLVPKGIDIPEGAQKFTVNGETFVAWKKGAKENDFGAMEATAIRDAEGYATGKFQVTKEYTNDIVSDAYASTSIQPLEKAKGIQSGELNAFSAELSRAVEMARAEKAAAESAARREAAQAQAPVVKSAAVSISATELRLDGKMAKMVGMGDIVLVPKGEGTTPGIQKSPLISHGGKEYHAVQLNAMGSGEHGFAVYTREGNTLKFNEAKTNDYAITQRSAKPAVAPKPVEAAPTTTKPKTQDTGPRIQDTKPAAASAPKAFDPAKISGDDAKSVAKLLSTPAKGYGEKTDLDILWENRNVIGQEDWTTVHAYRRGDFKKDPAKQAEAAKKILRIVVEHEGELTNLLTKGGRSSALLQKLDGLKL